MSLKEACRGQKNLNQIMQKAKLGQPGKIATCSQSTVSKEPTHPQAASILDRMPEDS